MWIQKVKELSESFVLLCQCVRKLNGFSSVSSTNGLRTRRPTLFKSAAAGRGSSGGRFTSAAGFSSSTQSTGMSGGGKRNEQRFCSCPCIQHSLRADALKGKFCLTEYLVYRTHPAFRSPFTSLSVWKRYKRSTIQLPVPRFLSSVSIRDQSDNRPRAKSITQDSLQSSFKNFGFQTCPFSSDMPSVRLDETTATSSPGKRKLSTSPVKSPEKKVLKQEQENQEEGANKMPSSVPSSPLKESGVTNVPPLASPLKMKSPAKALFKQEKVSKLQFAKLSEKAHVPTRGSKFAAGFDLKSAYEYTVPARGSCLVKTDIQVKVPEGTYGRVAPRSGLALKNQIDVGAGVIDQDYRGNVGVILFNLGDKDFHVSEGDRVAQLICEKIEYPELEELQTLDDTERGEGGFGSTGVKSN